MKKKILWCGSFLGGAVNGLLGAAGGVLVLPALVRSGLPRKKAHATSILVIFVFSVISSIIYICSGRVAVSQAFAYIPGGVLGAVTGAWLLTRLPDILLRRIFAIFILWAAVRLLVS